MKAWLNGFGGGCDGGGNSDGDRDGDSGGDGGGGNSRLKPLAACQLRDYPFNPFM